MTDMLQPGLAWLETQRKAHMSASVVYTPISGAAPVTLLATAGQTSFESGKEGDITIDSQTADWKVAYADLAAPPEPGDIITSAGRTFEVMPLGNEGCWRWMPGGISIRVHTKIRN